MEKQFFDLIILGAGPAGLQAAIHACRKKINVLILGRQKSSSLFSAHVENYCFVPGVKTGEELLITGLEQAKTFGAEFFMEDAVKTETLPDGMFQLTTEGDKVFETHVIIFATGVKRRGLRLKGERELVGKGISYCVDCDANFYKDAVVAVTGDGSAAAHGALTLAKIAKDVYLITKKLDVSAILMEELESSKVHIFNESKVKELRGDEKLEEVVLDNDKVLKLDCLFIEKGAKGAMELASFLGVQLDPEKYTYILTDSSQATNIPGIYAAGDICGPPFQMAKAVGEGCVAGISAGSYALKKRMEKVKK